MLMKTILPQEVVWPCPGAKYMYSLYKKKRKLYIIFNNLRTFEDEHFKLTGDLDWHVPYQLDEFYNFSCTLSSRFTSSCKGTHETKSHKNSNFVFKCDKIDLSR